MDHIYAVGFGMGLASIVFVYTRFRLGAIRRRLSREQQLREHLDARLRNLSSELETARNEILQQEAQLQELDRSRTPEVPNPSTEPEPRLSPAVPVVPRADSHRTSEDTGTTSRQSLMPEPSTDLPFEATDSAESLSAENTFIHKVIEAIGDGLAEEDFNVDELARRLAMDRSHLYRKLRALLGTTPSELIRSIRLQQAANLLGQRVGTVSEVAYQVGFRSVSQFSRSFRNRYGIPPSAYQSGSRPQDGSGSYSVSAS